MDKTEPNQDPQEDQQDQAGKKGGRIREGIKNRIRSKIKGTEPNQNPQEDQQDQAKKRKGRIREGIESRIKRKIKKLIIGQLKKAALRILPFFLTTLGVVFLLMMVLALGIIFLGGWPASSDSFPERPEISPLPTGGAGGGTIPPSTILGGWPTSGRITQGPYGTTSHSTLSNRALDISNGASPPVVTTFDGVVSEVHNCVLDGDCSRGWNGYGNSVLVRSNDNSGIAIYGHLASINVTPGQNVKRGDVLGIMGTTGVSSGIHLHWGFYDHPMLPPYIPQEITPSNCDTPDVPCGPASI